MFPAPDSNGVREDEVLGDRVESLAAWIQELDLRIRAAEVATGDEKTAKELRKAVEAAVKYDPKLEDRITNRVDVLKDRLATLAETVSTTTASLAAKDGEIVALRRALENEHARLEALSAQIQKSSGHADLDELRKSVAALSAERSRRRGDRGDGSDGVPGRIDTFEQRLEMLAQTVSATASGLASRDGELAALRRELEAGSAETKGALAEVRAAVDPAPVAELRIGVKELSERMATLKRQSQRTLDEVASKLDATVNGLNAVVRASNDTGARLAAREQELAALRAAFDEETGRLDGHVASMQQVLASLPAELAKLDGLADRASVEAMAARVQDISASKDALDARIEELAGSVEETGRGYAERELELAALSRRFDEARTQVEALVDELKQALATAGPQLEARLEARVRDELEPLRARIEAVATERAEAVAEIERLVETASAERETLAASARLLEERVQGVTDGVESAFRRLEQIEAQPAPGPDPEQAARLEALTAQVAAVERTLPEVRAALAGEVERAVAASADERDALAASARLLEERVQAVADGVESAFRRLEEIEAQPAPGPDPEQAARLEAVTAQVAAVERTLPEVRAALAGEVERAVAASADERDALAASARLLEERVQAVADGVESAFRRLEQIEAQPAPGPDPEQAARLEQLAERLEAQVATAASTSAAATDARAAVEALSARLDALGAAVEENAAADAEKEAELLALSRRFEDAGAKVDALVGELRIALETMPAARLDPDLGEQVAALAERVDAVAGHVQATASREETDRLLGKLLLRLDSVEAGQESVTAEIARAAAEPATLQEDVRELHSVIEALTARLAASEEQLAAVARSQQAASAETDRDGKLRIELRGLEVRMESAEAAARESREAVLRQLERLASRVEWRLQRLEPDEPSYTEAHAPPAVDSSGQIVPLRGSDV